MKLIFNFTFFIYLFFPSHLSLSIWNSVLWIFALVHFIYIRIYVYIYTNFENKTYENMPNFWIKTQTSLKWNYQEYRHLKLNLRTYAKCILVYLALSNIDLDTLCYPLFSRQIWVWGFTKNKQFMMVIIYIKKLTSESERTKSTLSCLIKFSLSVVCMLRVNKVLKDLDYGCGINNLMRFFFLEYVR